MDSTIDQRANSGRLWRVLLWIAAASVLYVLSSGPVAWWAVEHYNHEAFRNSTMWIYDPLIHSPPMIEGLWERYVEWWMLLATR